MAGTGTEPLPWDKILDYISSETVKRYRSISEPEDMAAAPITSKVEYAIDSLLAHNQPTTIFSPGGKGKSIFGDFLAITYQYGFNPSNVPFTPCQGNVLYLDWESDIEQHRKYAKAIKAGLGITENQVVRYLSCCSPLSAIIERSRGAKRPG